ncbi:PREDICTED: solute carrier family 13 member 5-like [Rhagoletis zephyria]|uniref:solute carrier family 13 member 5-like n=1 Tax=Rhagoletis zephyria TaxID=28612 RepID=UPI00081133E0|nr:PREDICTED: solute carrier family 13 member 5-like [Rhagoletis zephyria]
MVFLGSLIAATAVEKSNLHERVALKVILLSGTSPKRLLLGFMFTTAFLSMWISNLASVALMIPIVNAALDQLTRRKSVSYGTCHQEMSGGVIGVGGTGSRAGEAADADHAYITVDEKMRRKNSLRTVTQITSVGLTKKASRKLKKGILLGICYAANIGGTGTLTGSSTNLVLNAIYKE